VDGDDLTAALTAEIDDAALEVEAAAGDVADDALPPVVGFKGLTGFKTEDEDPSDPLKGPRREEKSPDPREEGEFNLESTDEGVVVRDVGGLAVVVSHPLLEATGWPLGAELSDDEESSDTDLSARWGLCPPSADEVEIEEERTPTPDAFFASCVFLNSTIQGGSSFPLTGEVRTEGFEDTTSG